MAISLGGFSGGGGAGAITSVNGLTGVVVVDGDNIESNHTAVNYTPTSSTIAGHLSGIDAKLGTLAAGLIYKGTFNATTGLTGSGGNLNNALQGDLYVIDTAGTIYGQTWAINDHLLINADMGGSVTNSKIDKIDNTEPTNVLITTNNLSDLNNVGTARTNLGLGTAATANTGTSNGNVVVLDATGLPAVDGSQLTNVTSTDSSKLAIANNLSDLNNVGTARTNLGLGTAATANTGTSNGNVVVLDATGLPAVDGSQLTNVTSTDSTKLAIANNLSDLNNVGTARTNLGLGTAATVDTGTSNGNVVVLDATGLPAVDGSQLTNVTSTDSSKLAIANNLSDLNNVGTARTNLGLGTAATAASTDFLQVSNNLSDVTAATARTNLGLGTAATANTGTSNGNVVLLDATGLPAVDGSQLTNVTATDSSKLAIANNLSDLNNAGTARTNLGLGTAATAASADFLQVSNNLSDVTAATARTNLGLGTAATAASTDFLQVSNNLSDVTAATARTNLGLGTAATAASTDFLSGTGADTLGGNLDVGTSDIVSSSNNNIEFAADGTGVVKVIPTATGGHLELNGDGTNVGKLRLMCEQSSHGIYLTGPSHSASASYTLKFPDTTGTNNYVLKTDGSGNLDWVAQSGGGSAPSVTTNTSFPLTISTTTGIEEVHLIDNGASAVVVTLPAVATAGTGYKYNIKRLGTGTVTIETNGSETIDGSANFAIGAKNDSITLVAVVQSGTDTWFLI